MSGFGAGLEGGRESSYCHRRPPLKDNSRRTRTNSCKSLRFGVGFEEAATVFGDWLAINMSDPDHSKREQRFLLLGLSDRQRLLVIPYAERPPRTRIISARPVTRRGRSSMKKAHPKSKQPSPADDDTMRPEYDFSQGVRGVTAARYAEGTNIVLLEPDVAAAFPNGAAVNKALRSLLQVTRSRSRRSPRKPGV
ncbi:MAG: BrnT family toxin [Gemmatimonadales bacterium]